MDRQTAKYENDYVYVSLISWTWELLIWIFLLVSLNVISSCLDNLTSNCLDNVKIQIDSGSYFPSLVLYIGICCNNWKQLLCI